jgi:DNA-directed RNA polymerase specialized sigma24 family protein
MASTPPAQATAWERLWKEHAGPLLLYATALLSDRSAPEDVLQSVFSRLLSRPDGLLLSSEPAYLYSAVRNEARSLLRTRHPVRRIQERLYKVSPGVLWQTKAQSGPPSRSRGQD